MFINRTSVFQFHKGTIRTSKPTTRRLLNANFNSIKVQLEHHTLTNKTIEIEISIP